jgi:5-methyltetrahydrofolate--homocysteine methyltransferase
VNALAQLRGECAHRILLFDGAYGTEIQALGLAEEDYRGALGLDRDQKGNHDILALTAPDAIAGVTAAYLAAGADVVSTNTFSANRISQADYGAGHLVETINLAAARIARSLADEHGRRDGRPRFVAGSVGPTNKTLSLSPDVNDPGYREIDFDTLKAVYREQIDALLAGGVDFILVETVFDTLNAKSAIVAAREAGLARAEPVQLMLSMTLTDLSGRNLSGHSVEAFWHSVRHAAPAAVGLNCSFGAEQLRPHLRALSDVADTLVLAYPNAGLPNELGCYDEAPHETAAQIAEWVEAGTVNIVGGCCGSTPAHIAALRELVAGRAPRQVPSHAPVTHLAGLDAMALPL